MEKKVAASMVRIPVATLRNGVKYPMLGLGCASGVREEHVVSALAQGYRLLDTASAYEWGYHEDEVGRAVARSGLRDQLFIQTKVRTLSGRSVRESVLACLERLGLEQVDAVLIHKPEGDWRGGWRDLEELYSEGRVRAIGVSDMTVALLTELMCISRVAPMILQNWMDPFHHDRGVRDFCRQHGIVYQSFSLLGTQWPHILRRQGCPNPVQNNTALLRLAAKHRRTVTQVVLRWALHEGVAVVPASKSASHRATNLELLDFELDADDLLTISKLDGTRPDEQSLSFASVN